MKTLIRRTLAALALALGFTTAATAATPVAVWDGRDNGFAVANLTQGAWTLSAGDDATITDGQITIGTAPITVKHATDVNTGWYTVVYRVKGLLSTSTTPLATWGRNTTDAGYDNANLLGALAENNTPWGIWNGAKRTTAPVTQNAMNLGTDATVEHKVVVRYHSGVDSGVWAYVDGVKCFVADNGLKATVGKVNRFSILGYYGKTTGTLTGAVVTGVAIFCDSTDAGDAEFTGYVWPSYQKFAYGTVYSWLTTGSGTVDFAGGSSNLQEFDLAGLTNKTTVYHGNTTYGGQAFWKLFAHATGINTTYAAPGEILRLSQGAYCTSIGATYGPLTIGGIIAEPGSTSFSFVNGSNGTRSNLLGDPTATTPTFFDIGTDVTFNRSGKLYLAGMITFDIADGKIFDLNSARTDQELALFSTIAAAGSGGFGATTAGGTLVMKGAGTLQVKTLKAEGSTLDYTHIPLSRETAYVSGTLQINGNTVIKLPAGLAKNTAFKMATTLAGVTSGTSERDNVYVGDTLIANAAVTFDTEAGTISYDEYVAQVGEEKFTSLAAAIEAAEAGETVSLLKGLGNDIAVDKALTLDVGDFALTGTLAIGANGVVMVQKGTGTFNPTVSGSGTLVYDNAKFPGWPTAPAGLTASGWTGTVWFKGYTGSADRGAVSFRNDGSTVKYTSVNGWFSNTVRFSNVELEDSGNTPALEINNGSSGWDDAHAVTMTNLTGTGTLKVSWNHVTAYPMLLKDISGFHGSLVAAASTAGYGIGLVIGPNTTSATADCGKGRIVLDADATATIASGKSWTAANGIFINGTVGGAGTLASATTFGASVTIDARTAQLTANGALTFPETTKVRVATAPTAETPVKVLNKSGTAAGLLGMAEVYVGDGAEPESGSFKLVYGADGVYVVAYAAHNLTLDADKTWSELFAGVGVGDYDDITIAANGQTLTFDTRLDKGYCVVISGDVVLKAGDAVYHDGCWEEMIVQFGSFTADGATFDETLKEGFYGAYTKTDRGVKLRAQNREVISINIAGGSLSENRTYLPEPSPDTHKIPADDLFYGLAPTPGRTWNNIDGRWKQCTTNVTLKGSKAFDGNEQQDRPSIDLVATAYTTWDANLANPFLRGYLDDGKPLEVAVHGIPYSKYDVIVYATSDRSDTGIAPIEVNGTKYTMVNGAVVEGNAVWGKGMCAVPAFGDNALYIANCSGEHLTITATRVGQTGANAGRATLCAVQVINQGTIEFATDYVADMTGDVVWTDGTDANLTSYGEAWENGQLSTITITNKAENATFTFAAETVGQQIKFVSEEGCALTIVAKSLPLGKLGVYDFTEAAGGVTIELPEGEAWVPSNLPGTIKGSWKFSRTGTIVFDGTFPSADYQTFFKSGDWAGTAWLKNVALAGTSLDNFCNADSVLRFTGVTGWLRHNSAVQGVPTLELVDDGETSALEITDSSENKVYSFSKFIGDGTFKFATKAGSSCVMAINDVSDFTGRLLSQNGKGTTARPIFIGTSGTVGTASLISVADGQTVRANCGWEAGSVAFGATLTVKGAVGDTIVGNVTNAVPVLGTKVTLDGEEGLYCLAYADGAVTVATPVAFTVADCSHATFTVAGAFAEGGSYYAADGAPVAVTYTADAGYAFANGTTTLVVNGTASAGGAIAAGEEPGVVKAKIGSVYYLTLKAAIDAANAATAAAGKAIVLCDDATLSDSTVASNGVLVAFGEFTLTVDADGKAVNLKDCAFTDAKIVLKAGQAVLPRSQTVSLSDDGAVAAGALALIWVEEEAFAKGGFYTGVTYAGSKAYFYFDNETYYHVYNVTKTADNLIYQPANTLTWTGATGDAWTDAGKWTFFVSENERYDVTWTASMTNAVAITGSVMWIHIPQGATVTPSAIVAEGATIINAGTLGACTLMGMAKLRENGVSSYGTVTLATGAVADVGGLRTFTFGGAGTVNVELTKAEFDAGTATVFTLAEGATTKIGTVTYDGKTYMVESEGGTITRIMKGGTMFFVK